MSVRTKVVVAVLVGMLVAGAAGYWLVDQVYRDSIALVAQRELQNTSSAFHRLVQAETDSLLVGTTTIAADQRVVRLVASGDRDGLESLHSAAYQQLRAESRVTHWYFEQTPEAGGAVILRLHRPALFGDKLDRLTYQQAVLNGTGAGLELGRTAFALRVVKAIRTTDGEVVGFVELGKEIDTVLGDLRAAYGNDYSLVVSKSRLGSDARADWQEIRAVYAHAGEWDDDPVNLLVDSTTTDDSVWSGDVDDLDEDGEILGTQWRDDKAIATVAFPIDDAGGTRIGAVLARIDVSPFYTRAREAQLRVLEGLGAIMLVLGISLTWYLGRLVDPVPQH